MTTSAIDSTLVEEINRRHRQVENAGNALLEHAVECGRLLATAKQAVAHGEWLPWLAENFDGSERTARVYMQLHENGPAVLDANRQRAADLSLRAALRAITPTREPARDDARLRRLLPGLNAEEPATPAPAPPPAGGHTPPARPPAPPAAPRPHVVDGEVVVDARVAIEPPPSFDLDQQRRWSHAEDVLATISDLLNEATAPTLAATSIANAIRDASHRARRLSSMLGEIAADIDARERRKPAA